MSRLLSLTVALLVVPACSSDPATPDGAAGSSGTSAAGTGGSAGTSAAGTSGSGTGGMAPTKDFPADTSVEGITAFIDALDYRSATWASAMTAPAEPAPEESSPHGLVQIWYNHALRASHAAGNSGSTTDATSMVVKELYTGTTVVGHAAMIRTADPKWIYYCTSTEASRCYSGAVAGTPVYQTSITNCGCHGGGTLLTESSIPAP